MQVHAGLTALLLFVVPALPADQLSPKQELAEGLKAAESYDWMTAAPHFRAAEAGLRGQDEFIAKVGLMRATMEQRNLARLTREYQLLSASPLVHTNSEARMWLYIAKGDCDNDLQFPEAARRDWQIVQEVATSIKNLKWVYRAKGEAAVPEYYLGDLASSRKLVSEALEAASVARDGASIVRLLTHIGTVYMLRGDFAKGFDHLNKAEQIASKTPGSPYPANVKEGQLLGMLRIGQLDKAFALANDIISRMHAQDRRINESQTRVMLAGIFEQQKKIPQAIEQLKIAIDIAEKGNYYHSLSEAEIALAKLYLQLADRDKATYWVAQAVEHTKKSGVISDLPARLQLLARLRTQQGRYSDANTAYRQAEDEVDAQLALTPPSSKQLWLKSTSEIYTNHFELVAEHFHNVESDYGIVERVRGRALTDLLNARPAIQGAESSTTEQEVSALRLKLAGAKTAGQVTRARDAIFFARHRRWLEEETTPTKSFSSSTETVVPLPRVRRNLLSAELLLEYVVTPQSVYAVVITRDSERLADLGSAAIIKDSVEAFVSAVRQRTEAFAEGAALYRQLFKDIPEVATHTDLVIVPDGLLHSVPFAALVVDSKRLVETHSIVRAPSASSYVLLRERSSGAASNGLLAVGGVQYSQDLSQVTASRGHTDRLRNLPGSQEEANAAVAALGPRLGRNVVLEARSATETALKSAMKEQREVIHLAVHGLSHSKDDPELAALVLLPDQPAGEDGLLEVTEIVRLHLRSDLVVLSACETAVGQLQGEEGVSNLSRSFLLAGAESVASTLWSVDDSFSATLMKRFYQELAKGVSRVSALANAQRSVLREFAGTATPWYWAGYVIEGNASAPLSSFEAKTNAR